MMQATHRELLNLNPLLTQADRTSNFFPHLQPGALISIGQLCDDGCIATFTNTSGNPPPNLDKYGIANTGETKNYTRVNTPCSNNKQISNGSPVILPDSRMMQATHRELLNLNPLLTQADRTSNFFPHLQPGALISIGQLCDDGCIATFTNTHLSIVKDGLTVLKGNRSSTSGMWQINLTSNPTRPPSQQQLAVLNALAARSNPELAN